MASTHTVLIVDDDTMTRTMMRANLEKLGLNILEAADGRQALEIFNRSRPDLVLMDMQMPNLDGVRACKKIRALPHCKTLPIIIVTNLADSDSAKRAAAAGATDFITKPIHWSLLSHRVQHYLNVHGRLSDDETAIRQRPYRAAD